MFLVNGLCDPIVTLFVIRHEHCFLPRVRYQAMADKSNASGSSDAGAAAPKKPPVPPKKAWAFSSEHTLAPPAAHDTRVREKHV